MTTAQQTLIDRYVSAVVHRVPGGQRQDVAAELRASLADAVEDLMAQGAARPEAEDRAVRELGDPATLAARYGGRPQHLIGPAYYADYARLLRTLSAVVIPTVAVVVLLAEALSGAGPLAVVTSALGVALQVGVQLAFWVTLVFVQLERSGAQVRGSTWSPADLPEVADRRIGLGDTVVAVSLQSLLIWALLWQRTHWLVTTPDGAQVPVLDPGLWTFWLPALIAVLAASILLEIAKYRIGRWTVRLAAVNTILNLAFAGIVLWLSATDSLLNPAVAQQLPAGVDSLLATVPWVVALIAVIDTASAWWNVRRAR